MTMTDDERTEPLTVDEMAEIIRRNATEAGFRYGDPIEVLLSRVAAEVGPIEKADRNEEQRFMYRGIDRIMERVGPLLHEHGISVVPHVLDVAHRYTERGANKNKWEHYLVTVEYAFVGPLGDRVTAVVVGEGLDNADKGVSKAMTVAYKTVLLQVLGIGSGGDDPDGTSPEDGPSAGRQSATARPAKKQAAKKAPAKPKTAEEIVKGLAGEFGPEHAARVARLIDRMNAVTPEADRKIVKDGFVAVFGSPAILHPDKVEDAEEYLTGVLDSPTGDEVAPEAPAAQETATEAPVAACSTCGRTDGKHEDGCPEAPF